MPPLESLYRFVFRDVVHHGELVIIHWGAASPRANSGCVASSAAFIDFRSTTKEILDSEDPWAMAMMLTPSRPSALKVRPPTPGIPRMFSPTTATIATF